MGKCDEEEKEGEAAQRAFILPPDGKFATKRITKKENGGKEMC